MASTRKRRSVMRKSRRNGRTPLAHGYWIETCSSLQKYTRFQAIHRRSIADAGREIVSGNAVIRAARCRDDHDNLAPQRPDVNCRRTESSLDSSPARLRCLAVLGQRDEPTDAVEEYCRYLGDALGSEQIALELFRVRWAEIGWPASMRELHSQARDLKSNWCLLQYTALAWSRRGFPFRILRLVQFLKKQGARCAIVFHDAEAYCGDRWVDAVRRNAQLFVMRRLLRASDIAIFTLPRDRISWIPASTENVVFIPVGANLPVPERAWTQERNSADPRPVVAVFSITGKEAESEEVNAIAEAVTHAAKETGPLRLTVLGRNSEIGGERLKARLRDSPVEVSVLGLIPAEEVVHVLALSDVLLFVRGPISSSRGSAIAGIACGLPVIAREGRQTAPPITGAGVVLVPPDILDFGAALVRVLTDHSYRASLAERSRNAQKSYFSWSVIAAQYAQELRKDSAAR